MLSNRPIVSMLYGLHYDEQLTIDTQSEDVINYNVEGVVKNENVDIPLGYFATPEYEHVSAVIYSSLATWGKLRALADNPEEKSVYITFHPNGDSIYPTIKKTIKRDYQEHLLDGLYICHNPFAKHPLNPDLFSHERIAQLFVKDDGELSVIAPDDFLSIRMVHTLTEKKA